MSIKALSQLDAQWANIRIGRSAATIGRYGCTIVSLCMGLNKLRGFPANPPDAARYWKFNPKGEILWPETKFDGMAFIETGYTFDFKKIANAANAEHLAVILAVNNRKHWVYVEKVEGKDIHIIDPLGGIRSKLPAKYKPCGYSLFQKNGKEIPDWATFAWTRAQQRIPHLQLRHANDEMTMDDIQNILLDLKKIKTIGGMPAYRLAVIFENLGLL